MAIAGRRLADKPKINRNATNRNGIIASCKGLEDRILAELRRDERFSGKINVLVQVIDGFIDRHHTGVDPRRPTEYVEATAFGGLSKACQSLRDRIEIEIEENDRFFGSISVYAVLIDGNIVDSYTLIENSTKNAPVYS